MPVLTNLNYEVEVRLTHEGIKILGTDPCARWYKTSVDGWTTFQLWDLMRLFGPHLYNGCSVPFETTIRIKKVE